jgi:hypothetical protein
MIMFLQVPSVHPRQYWFTATRFAADEQTQEVDSWSRAAQQEAVASTGTGAIYEGHTGEAGSDALEAKGQRTKVQVDVDFVIIDGDNG